MNTLRATIVFEFDTEMTHYDVGDEIAAAIKNVPHTVFQKFETFEIEDREPLEVDLTKI